MARRKRERPEKEIDPVWRGESQRLRSFLTGLLSVLIVAGVAETALGVSTTARKEAERNAAIASAAINSTQVTPSGSGEIWYSWLGTDEVATNEQNALQQQDEESETIAGESENGITATESLPSAATIAGTNEENESESSTLAQPPDVKQESTVGADALRSAADQDDTPRNDTLQPITNTLPQEAPTISTDQESSAVPQLPSKSTGNSSISAKVTDISGTPQGTKIPLPSDGTQLVWLPQSADKSGKGKYHSRNDCGNMNPAKAYQVTIAQAIAEGHKACKNCWES